MNNLLSNNFHLNTIIIILHLNSKDGLDFAIILGSP